MNNWKNCPAQSVEIHVLRWRLRVRVIISSGRRMHGYIRRVSTSGNSVNVPRKLNRLVSGRKLFHFYFYHGDFSRIAVPRRYIRKSKRTALRALLERCQRSCVSTSRVRPWCSSICNASELKSEFGLLANSVQSKMTKCGVANSAFFVRE